MAAARVRFSGANLGVGVSDAGFSVVGERYIRSRMEVRPRFCVERVVTMVAARYLIYGNLDDDGEIRRSDQRYSLYIERLAVQGNGSG